MEWKLFTVPVVSCASTLVPHSVFSTFCITGFTATPRLASSAFAWFCQPTDGSVAVPDSPMTKR